MSNILYYKLLEACREKGCPVCRVEAQSVERYIGNQFYENVNSPKWRDRLRLSLGFCREHAWLAVDKRLGDALGFSIIYRDVVNSILSRMEHEGDLSRPRLRQVPEQVRRMAEKLLYAITASGPCPICEYRDDTRQTILSVLVAGLKKQELVESLRTSDGLCLLHLQKTVEQVKDVSVSQALLTIHRERLEKLRAELMEFIRKNDYQAADEGFGAEGDAWLRAVTLVVGSRRV